VFGPKTMLDRRDNIEFREVSSTTKAQLSPGDVPSGARRGFVACVLVVTVIAAMGSAAAAPPTPPFISRHQIDAEVTEVDRDGGTIRLKSEAGRVVLRGVAGTEAAVKRGTPVMMELTVIPHPRPASVVPRRAEPPPLLAQGLPGSVAGIQRNVGVVALKSPAGRISVELPAGALASLHTGDAVWLEFALRPAPDVSALPGGDGSRQTKSLKTLFLMLLGRTK
jgi:hypothetical protein